MTAIYWETQYFGLWVAPNPLPGQTMDTLLQVEFRLPRHGLSDMMLRIKRTDLIDALSKAKAFWAAWKPGVNAVYGHGRFLALGDADFRYYIAVSTLHGVYGAESREDARGVKIGLERDAIPDAAPKTKRKADANRHWELLITASDFARLCNKLEIA